MPACFITVEGIEGAGKSTQIERMHAWLLEHGHDVILTRQPGGTPLAEKMRDLLLDRRNSALSPKAELLLVFAAREQFVDELVRPALARDRTVLCDRFTDSTYAYQGGGRGMNLHDLAALETFVHGDLQPDLTILLDIPIEVGLARAAQRGEADRFEIEDQAFFERVREAYLIRASRFTERFAVINASGDPDTVWKAVCQVLESRVGG